MRLLEFEADEIDTWVQAFAHRPDVLVLDIEMHGMDGPAFLDTLMRQQPLPVVVCSCLAENGAAL